jgi:zinc/manganese transport system substrate-binding protein
MKMRSLWFSLAAFTLWGAAPAEAKINAFACEPEWGALAIELGGDLIDVYIATTGQQNQHQVQARPSLIAKARAADIAICTGAELEITYMPLIARQSGNVKIQPGALGFFEATSFVELLDRPASLDRSQGDIHAYGNPHIQTDPRYILFVAKPLADRFAEIDPANAAAYAANYADFAARFQAAIEKWQAKAAPLAGVPIAVQHKSWVYLETWLGLREVVALEPKIGVPPSSGYLAQVVATLQQQPVKMVIRAAYEDPRSSEFISKRVGVKAVMLPFTVGGTEEATDLFGLYEDTIDRLLAAVQP